MKNQNVFDFSVVPVSLKMSLFGNLIVINLIQWVQTPNIDTVTWPFLKFDRGHEALCNRDSKKITTGDRSIS